ncbi:hypothetical protein Ais01nite_35790 [Asanoa ishikariensis]|nr:hypothetical protein Ais01nite_35790 [Asanoa ishikariensis]
MSPSRPGSLKKLALAPATAIETAVAGTVANLTGTRRPARPIIQRGKRSPHGRTSPTVSHAPTSAKPPSPVAASARSGSSNSPSTIPEATATAKPNRVTA